MVIFFYFTVIFCICVVFILDDDERKAVLQISTQQTRLLENILEEQGQTNKILSQLFTYMLLYHNCWLDRVIALSQRTTFVSSDCSVSALLYYQA